MNSQYRILIEDQVRQIDEKQRNFTLMRSALVSRLESLVTEPATTTATVTTITRRTHRTVTAEAHAEAEQAVARAVAEAQALRDSGAPAITIDVTHNVTAEAQAEAERAVARAVAQARAVTRAPVRSRPTRVPISQLADYRARLLQERRIRMEERKISKEQERLLHLCTFKTPN